MLIQDKIKGAIIGHIVGNALGYYYSNNFIPNPSQSVISSLLAHGYTEPGCLLLCAIKSIIESGYIDLEDIVYLYHEWYLASYMSSSIKVNINGRVSIAESMRLYSDGMPPDKCGSYDTQSDDSALIRILPIAIWCRNDELNQFISNIELSTKFTNQQTDALVCSSLYALLIRGILNDKKENIADLLANFYDAHNMTNHKLILLDILNQKCDKTTRGLIGLFWSVWNTYKMQRHDYEKAITLAFQISGDYESMGCLTGALVGATSGISQIPNRWIKQIGLPLDGREAINEFIAKTTKQE